MPMPVSSGNDMGSSGGNHTKKKKIAKKDKDELEIVPYDPHHPLVDAIGRRSPEDLTKLIHAGDCNVNIRFEGDLYTLCHVAVEGNEAKCLEILLTNGVDVNARDYDKTTCLHVAANQGYTECVRVLIEQGSEIDPQDSDLCTPAHYASRRGHVAILASLLDAGADMFIENALNHQLMHTAARKGQVGCLRLLLERLGDNPIARTVNSQGFNPAMTAAENGKDACLALLLDYKGGGLSGGCADVGFAGLEKISAGDESSERGRTAEIGLVHLCAEIGSAACLRVLLSRGYDVNERALHGVSALMCCVENEEYECMRLLIAHGGDVDACDDKGDTALHYAVELASGNGVRILLNAGANASVRNAKGKTALDVCVQEEAFGLGVLGPPAPKRARIRRDGEVGGDDVDDEEEEEEEEEQSSSQICQMLRQATRMPPSLKVLVRKRICQWAHNINGNVASAENSVVRLCRRRLSSLSPSVSSGILPHEIREFLHCYVSSTGDEGDGTETGAGGGADTSEYDSCGVGVRWT